MLVHKIFILQSYSLFLCVFPRDPTCHFVNICDFDIHASYQSGIIGQAGGGGGEQGQQGENA